MKSYSVVNDLFAKINFLLQMSDLQFCIADRPRYVVEINMGLLGRPTARKFDRREREGRWMKRVWGGLSGDLGGLQCCSISA